MPPYGQRQEPAERIGNPRQEDKSSSFQGQRGSYNYGTRDYTAHFLNNNWRGQQHPQSTPDQAEHEGNRPADAREKSQTLRSSDWRGRFASRQQGSVGRGHGQLNQDMDIGAIDRIYQPGFHQDLNTRIDNQQLSNRTDVPYSQQAPGSTFHPYQPLRFSANADLPSQAHIAPNRSPFITKHLSLPSSNGTASWYTTAAQNPSPLGSDQINPTGPRQGLEALRNSRPSPRQLSRTVSPPLAPSATDLYLAQSRLPIITRESAQRLLLVLDLNGTLIARRRRSEPASFKRRPGLDKFFEYIFANHVVMIYTSSQSRTVKIVLPLLFNQQQRDQLTAVWTRDKLGLTVEQFREKVQVYKRLEDIWTDPGIQASYPGTLGEWNQTNTILIDDSHLKALAQPHNLLQVPEFLASSNEQTRHFEEQILESTILKLEELKYQADVSRLVRLWQTGEKEFPEAPLRAPPAPQDMKGQQGDGADPTRRDDTSLGSVEDELAGRMAHMSTDGSKSSQEPLEPTSSRDDENGILLPGLSVRSDAR